LASFERRASVLECGGPPPLSPARHAFKQIKTFARAKAVSPLRSATAVQNLAEFAAGIPKSSQIFIETALAEKLSRQPSNLTNL